MITEMLIMVIAGHHRSRELATKQVKKRREKLNVERHIAQNKAFVEAMKGKKGRNNKNNKTMQWWEIEKF